MCLILFAYRAHPDFPLVVAANRDEYYRRPSREAHFWPDAPQVLAGRDLQAGGTWMGVTRGGRFAAVTNVRNGPRRGNAPRSRGELTADFLRGDQSARGYLESVMANREAYNGFNLLLADEKEFCYGNSITGEVTSIAPGIYGLSNHMLDSEWPKVAMGRQALSELLLGENTVPANEQTRHETFSKALLDMLANREIAADHLLPNTGVPLAAERMLSSMFIESDEYGTCSSTAIIVSAKGELVFRERRFDITATQDDRIQDTRIGLQLTTDR